MDEIQVEFIGTLKVRLDDGIEFSAPMRVGHKVTWTTLFDSRAMLERAFHHQSQTVVARALKVIRRFREP